jgi:hypothetical protein
MGTQQGLFFQALIERFPHPKLRAVLEAAPEEIFSQLRTLPDKAGIAPEMVWTTPRSLLLSLHPSWHEEIIEHCPQVLQPRLRTLLQDAREHPKDDKNPVALFLLDYLVSQWPDKQTQGVEAIEETPLRWLADCDEQRVAKIADLLAVHDVVDIIRHIVDKKILQKILSPFSPFQQRYLRSLLHRPIHSATLNKELLALLKGNSEEARARLLQRGFERIGQSLKEAPPLLIWHVLHHVDRERAQFLSEVLNRTASGSELAEAKRNAIHAHEFLKRTEKP